MKIIIFRVKLPKMDYLKVLIYGEDTSCRFCGLKNHKSYQHKCNICEAIGTHSAKVHCKICKSLDHTAKDHTCHKCNIYEPHTHECIYCIENHKTEMHVCTICEQKGHNYTDHQQKCLCETCNVVGHLEKDIHFDCDKCGYIIVNDYHVWCYNCNSCTFSSRPHIGTCEFCQGCMANSNYCYECEARCIKCRKIAGDPEKYDINAGIRIKK